MSLLQKTFGPRRKKPVDAPVVVVERGNDPLAHELAKRLATRDDELDPKNWAQEAYGRFYATSVPVYRAVRLRADAVARARLKAYQLRRDGEREWVGENHPVQRLLDKVNPWWSRNQMWKGIESYLCLYGAAFTWVNKPSPNDVTTWEMWLLRPDKVAVVRDKEKYIKGFVYDPGGANFPMLPEEVIWDRYFNPLEEYAGMSPIAPSRLSIEMQRDMLKVNRDLFNNGMMIQNLAFIMQGPMNQEQVDTFHERLAARHTGVGNTNRPIIVDRSQGADIKNLGFSTREMEFIAGIQLTKEHVADALGVPEELMAGAAHPTFSNRAEARREFYSNTITQEWDFLSSNRQENFIPMLPSQYRDLILDFDTSGVEAMTEDQNEVSTRTRAELAAGAITLNEFRRANGYDERPEYEVLFVPTDINPVLAGEAIEPIMPAVAAPAQEGRSTPDFLVELN